MEHEKTQDGNGTVTEVGAVVTRKREAERRAKNDAEQACPAQRETNMIRKTEEWPRDSGFVNCDKRIPKNAAGNELEEDEKNEKPGKNRLNNPSMSRRWDNCC